jgi:hypothetical protein
MTEIIFRSRELGPKPECDKHAKVCNHMISIISYYVHSIFTFWRTQALAQSCGKGVF